jgi:hypothetical protein
MHQQWWWGVTVKESNMIIHLLLEHFHHFRGDKSSHIARVQLCPSCMMLINVDLDIAQERDVT